MSAGQIAFVYALPFGRLKLVGDGPMVYSMVSIVFLVYIKEWDCDLISYSVLLSDVM